MARMESQVVNDPDTWRAVPASANLTGADKGRWAVAAGDAGEYDLYVEVMDAEDPKAVAEFIAAAVRLHARKLWLEGALADIQEERDRLKAEPPLTDANVRRIGYGRLLGLVEQLGQISAEVNKPRNSTWAKLEQRVYPQMTRMAALLVIWMEQVREDQSKLAQM